MQSEKSHYDFIILGTGLTESILSGALSRAGKSVLQLEKNNIYGNDYQVLQAKDLFNRGYKCKFIAKNVPANSHKKEDMLSQEAIDFTKTRGEYNFRNAELVDYMLKRSKDFNFEMIPKLLYSRGEVIELIIKSGVGPSLEFQIIKSLSILQNGLVVKTPGSKEDVFGDKSISLINKRRLMKFLSFCLDFNSGEATDSTSIPNYATSCGTNITDSISAGFSATDRTTTGISAADRSTTAYSKEVTQIELERLYSIPFVDYLLNLKLSPELIETTITAIALETNFESYMKLSALDGILQIQKHLFSMGRYGPGAFLTAVYGTGSELCQSFCRYSAIYGGSFILDPALDINFKAVADGADGKTSSAICGKNKPNFQIQMEEQTYTSNILIADSKYLCNMGVSTEKKYTRRMICTSRGKFLEDCHSILVIPCDLKNQKNGLVCVQYFEENQICPNDFYVLVIWEDGVSNQKTFDDFYDLVEKLASDVVVCFEYCSVGYFVNRQILDPNVRAIESPSHGVGVEDCVMQARILFEEFCPGQEFYPRKADVEE